MSFKDFNIDMEEYNQQIKELDSNQQNEENVKKEYKEVVDGDYECALMGLDIGTNKAGDKLMLKGSFKVLDGAFKNQRLWINKVLTGCKNQAWAVKSAVDFLNSLGSAHTVEFTGDFDDLATQITIVCADVNNCVFLVTQKTNGSFKNYYVNEVWDN